MTRQEYSFQRKNIEDDECRQPHLYLTAAGGHDRKSMWALGSHTSIAVTTPFKKLQHLRSKQVEVIKEYSRQYGVFGLQVSIRTCIFFFIFSFCGYSSISYISSCGKQRVKLRGGKALRRTLVWVLHLEKLQHQRPNQVEVIKEYSRQYGVFGLWAGSPCVPFFS